MGRLLRHVVFLAAAVLAVYSCKSESSRPMERDMTARMAERGAEEIGAEEIGIGGGGVVVDDEEDDEIDETAEDIAEDEEDFDLICDGHVEPNRTRRLPDVVIIGSKKGGTRALIEFLKLHPKVKAAGPEIHYFDKHLDKGEEWYASRMPAVTEDQLATEKTPGYFHHPEAPSRVKDTLPDVKMLLIFRDPVKRLISDYNQFRSRHLDSGGTYPSLEELLFTVRGEINENYPPLQRSLYHAHMARWYEHFPREQIHILHGESFIREPWSELQKVERFLGLEPVIGEQHFFFNGTKGFYCAKDTRTTGGVWECTKRKCLSKSKGRPKPPVMEETTEKLTAFFKEYNKMFYQLVGRDFGWPAD